MVSKKQNPALLAAGRVSVNDLAGASINPDNKPTARDLQAARLVRVCAISFAMAKTVAPLVYGEAA